MVNILDEFLPIYVMDRGYVEQEPKSVLLQRRYSHPVDARACGSHRYFVRPSVPGPPTAGESMPKPTSDEISDQ